MADITIGYKGETIAEISASGTTTLETAGKYCEDNIVITYVQPNPSSATDITITYGESTIAEVSASGTTTLGTKGKYCTSNILLEYVRPSIQIITDDSIYLLRQLPYNSNAKTMKKLVGCSFAWNQLQENGNFESTSNIEAYYGTLSASNGVLSYTVSSIALNEWSSQIRMPSVSCVDGHKHLITFAIKPAHSKTNQSVAFLLRTSGSGPNIGFGWFNLVGGEWNRIGYIANVNASGTTYGTLQILFNATSANGYSVGDVDQVKDVMCIDLTRLFGSTIADYIYGLGNTDGVAFFKNLFPKDYYPYDAGTLVSVKPTASKMMNADESSISSYPLSGIELRGLPNLVNNALAYDGDEYLPDGTVTRKYGIRQYQSGDESLADAITDGTNTVYKLQSATAESTNPYTARQTCYPNGTEQFVDGRTVEIPVNAVAGYEVPQ